MRSVGFERVHGCLSVSVDGKWVAVVTAGCVFVLDAGTGKRVATVR